MTAITQEESKLLNQALFDKISSRDPYMVKEAVDAVNDFTRTKMREDGFFRKIMPPVEIANEDLDRMVETDKPIKVVDKEPDSPAAISIPFATLPTNEYIKGQRYAVVFQRIVTPRFTKDVDELRTWIMDIRQVLSDNAIKDMLAEEDGKFIASVDSALVGAGTTLPTSGTIQYKQIGGGITRNSIWDAMKVMPETPCNLEVHTVLINHITVKDLCKFGRDEMGGNLAEDIMRRGWAEREFRGARHIITVKKDLIPTNHEYHFSDPKFIGKHYQLEDTTMFIERKAYMLEFFAYENSGASLGHLNGLAHVHYN